jgi:hypothetical protein
MRLNGDLKSSDIIQIGVLHLCWYVAAVYAIKLQEQYIFGNADNSQFYSFSFSESPVFIVLGI